MTTRVAPLYSVEARRLVPVSVTLRSPDGILWQAELAVSQRGGARWQQSKSEVPAEQCTQNEWTGESEQNELSVNMHPSGGGDRFTVHVRWARPAATACGGTRIVEIRATPTLRPGEPLTLRGDGGLVVELRRR